MAAVIEGQPSTGGLGFRVSQNRGRIMLGVLVAWLVLWFVTRGSATLPLGPSQLTDLHRGINNVNDSIGEDRNTSWIFVYFFNEIRAAIDALVVFIQSFIAQPSFNRPVPVIGWFGVVCLVGLVSYLVANIRVALVAMAGFFFLGLQGLWRESMDTLSLTLAAVLISLLVGIPLGIWAGMSDRFNRIMTPVLDFMQIMPSFVYLVPLTLFFLIGPASATIATLIYAAPPVIRLTAHGIRNAPHDTVEASESMGSTRSQLLTKVLLPSAKRTIVLGINQTIMAALAMVTIAALIDAPGLGKTVIKALQTLDVGTAFNAGLAIVVMAIVLDRVTTAAAQRDRNRPHWSIRAVLGAGTLFALWISYTYVWAAEFPSNLNIGSAIGVAAGDATLWVQSNLSPVTNGIKDVFTVVLIDPLQALLADSPWWLFSAVIVVVALVIGSVRAAIVSAVCLGLLVLSGLWQDGMTTLASTLVATVITMVIGIVVGVWMGRSHRADRIIRPILDAAQTMPAFVYLVPFLALFAASRFTAIAAAVVYAAPVATKIVADGIRGVSGTTVEAAVSTGSSAWQTITKVQLPMSVRALTLATNQGLIYVLSMVVVGGLVGAGALGYDVVAGFSQGELYGKGLAAGIAIVLLGVMLDRLTQAAANRMGRGAPA
jgi:glycine betaine/proline transport system permease protein